MCINMQTQGIPVWNLPVYKNVALECSYLKTLEMDIPVQRTNIPVYKNVDTEHSYLNNIEMDISISQNIETRYPCLENRETGYSFWRM